jgi:hypothetical protein
MMQKSILCRRAALVLACAVLGGCVAPVDEGRVGVGIGVGVPGARLGIHVGAYPELFAVPGYPVYYAPALDLNLFFYDGRFWVFAEGDWYSSYWYDGPWDYVAPG